MSRRPSGLVDAAAELAELRAIVTRLEEDRRAGLGRPAKIGLVTTLALIAALLAGVAGASGPSNTGLSFVAVNPAFKLATNASVAAGATASYAVLGGSTTVPTDATTVQLAVAVKGTKTGTLSVYPAANVAGGSGQSLTWPAGGSTTGTLMENIGAANKVSFHNASTAAATLTVTITGYSTQVAASDINGIGGSSGQVLTDTGSGASWQTLPPVAATGVSGTGGSPGQVLTDTGAGAAWQSLVPPSAGNFNGAGGSAGQVLTNNGSGGAAWQTTGQAYTDQLPLGSSRQITTMATTVNSVTVPAGTYSVNEEMTLYDAAGDRVTCELASLNTQHLGEGQTVQAPSSVTPGYQQLVVQSIVVLTSTGTIATICTDTNGNGEVAASSLIANQIGAGHGPAIVN